MELDEASDAGGDASSKNDNNKTLKGNADDPMPRENSKHDEKKNGNDEDPNSNSDSIRDIDDSGESSTDSETASSHNTDIATTNVSELAVNVDNKPTTSLAEMQGSMSAISNKLEECARNLKVKELEVQAKAAGDEHKSDSSITEKTTVITATANSAEQQGKQTQLEQQQIKTPPPPARVTCICGLIPTKCCELRRELRSAIDQLIYKYPELWYDIHNIQSGDMTDPRNGQRRFPKKKEKLQDTKKEEVPAFLEKFGKKSGKVSRADSNASSTNITGNKLTLKNKERRQSNYLKQAEYNDNAYNLYDDDDDDELYNNDNNAKVNVNSRRRSKYQSDGSSNNINNTAYTTNTNHNRNRRRYRKANVNENVHAKQEKVIPSVSGKPSSSSYQLTPKNNQAGQKTYQKNADNINDNNTNNKPTTRSRRRRRYYNRGSNNNVNDTNNKNNTSRRRNRNHAHENVHVNAGSNNFPLRHTGRGQTNYQKQAHIIDDNDYYDDFTNNHVDAEIFKKYFEKKNINTLKQKPLPLTAKKCLINYINDMIKEYCTDNDNNIDYTDELHFKIDDDLKMYADKLINAGLGRIVDAPICINRKKNHQSFVHISTDPETTERDGIILIPVARQYAFEGDIVRAFVLNAKSLPKSKISSSQDLDVIAATTSSTTKITTTTTKDDKIDNTIAVDDKAANDNDDCDIDVNVDDIDIDVIAADELDDAFNTVTTNCPKAFVIEIIEKTENREFVGYVNFKNIIQLPEYDNSRKFLKFRPIDRRIPMIYLDVAIMEVFMETDKSILCVSQVISTDDFGYCMGKIIDRIGIAGELSAEVKAILRHNGLKHIQPYEARFNELNIKEIDVTKKTTTDINNVGREDLTKLCVFTIDPLTARDLDDALSLELIESNEYEVGVHISDVSYYIKENSELDNIVKKRCTSIYMVNEVIHMLPQPLCLNCSLLPDQNKYAFSVFRRFSADGKLLNKQPRYTRSIIRSCAQLAYEHAQYIIDNAHEDIKKIEEANILPNIVNGFTIADIIKRVQNLHKLSSILRKGRFDDGALTIKNPKLRFNFDADTMEPLSYEIEKRQEANFMIEEFMLLANQTVANFIYENYPEISILRNHPPPLLKCMRDLSERMAARGINIDYSSSKAVQESIDRICREASDPIAMNTCLSILLMKPMARAKYLCSDGKSDRDLWHYALSIPIYTHFTSPIRRYPDILVHRLLAAGLHYCEKPKRTIDELHEIVRVCNETQYNAKNADDESSQLFFMRYVRRQVKIIMPCVVTEIMANLMNVATIETGHVVPILYRLQKVTVDASQSPKCVFIVNKKSKKSPLCLQVASTVDVALIVKDDRLCAFIVSPDNLTTHSK